MSNEIEVSEGLVTLKTTDRGKPATRHLRADAVFIRASDGAVCVSSGLLDGPLRTALTDDEAAMAGALDLVKKVGAL